LSTHDEEIRSSLERSLKEWTDFFKQALDDAVAPGDMPPTDTALGAQALLAYLEGILLLAKTENSLPLL
jgi:TetR/AcrR family transcriptional repressor of nem operon